MEARMETICRSYKSRKMEGTLQENERSFQINFWNRYWNWYENQTFITEIGMEEK